jgi:hypothetical protein
MNAQASPHPWDIARKWAEAQVKPIQRPNSPKYIICDVEGIPTAQVFGGHVKHSDVVPRNASGMLRWPVLSAGFYDPVTGICYGYSETLGVSSSHQDSEIIKAFLRQ